MSDRALPTTCRQADCPCDEEAPHFSFSLQRSHTLSNYRYYCVCFLALLTPEQNLLLSGTVHSELCMLTHFGFHLSHLCTRCMRFPIFLSVLCLIFLILTGTHVLPDGQALFSKCYLPYSELNYSKKELSWPTPILTWAFFMLLDQQVCKTN